MGENLKFPLLNNVKCSIYIYEDDMQLGKKIKENCLLLVLLTVHKHADRSDQIIDIHIPFRKHTYATFNCLGTEGIIFNL